MLTDTIQSAIQYVPLDLLQLSPENSAKVGRDDVEDLIASIRVHGLQQNLIVQAGADGMMLVKGGGRRLRALQHLAAAGEWSAEVPVNVLPADANVVEISLAENIQRKDMHPVDEFAAFKKLIDTEGLSSADIAARFGKSQLYVDQRLKLANVSPKILDLFEQDKIKLSQVMALSVNEDHAAQEKVWKGASNDWQQRPDSLRKELVEKELVVGDDNVATYLGAKAYEAGGGSANRDLFSEMVSLPDSRLARSLAKEKLEKAAKKVRDEGWAWIEVRLEFGWNDESKFSTPYGYSGGKQWSDVAKKNAGAVVSIAGGGKVSVTRGLVKPEDARKAAAASKSGKVSHAAAWAKPKAAKKPGQLSFAAVQRLQGERTAVLRKVLSTDPRRALAALAADLKHDRGIAFAVAAGVDMHDHWKPTEAWLSEQPKAVVLEAVTEALGKKVAADLQKLKKDGLATRAAALLAPTNWIPKQLRAPTPPLREKKVRAAGKTAAAGG